MGSKDDNLQTPTHDRVKAMMAVRASAQQLKTEGLSVLAQGQHQSVPLETARTITEQWPEAPRMAAESLLGHYGAPNEATPTKLFWYRPDEAVIGPEMVDQMIQRRSRMSSGQVKPPLTALLASLCSP